MPSYEFKRTICIEFWKDFRINQKKHKLTEICNNPWMFAVSFSDIDSHFRVVLCKLHDFLVDVFPAKCGRRDQS